VSPAAQDLLLLPGLLLSMYRASAPNFYGQDICGNMFLYNDSLYIAEKLRSFAEHQAKRNSSNTALDNQLNFDISALELFGKRCYGKEMESQRTILSDLLDGAQGFANPTEEPFAQQCDLAISSTVDRLREVHAQWKDVLSHSALLQSIGSLLGTVINKMILDIEDLSDISEPESQRLTAFCNGVIALADLFISDDEAGGEKAVSRTAVYTPHWLKFQYLANILESSLADIKYLWMEAELSLEFGKEELIDLIVALFADSEHRRRAIGEIRRDERGQ
jgi:centromere/kinetochore protein ZW10